MVARTLRRSSVDGVGHAAERLSALVAVDRESHSPGLARHVEDVELTGILARRVNVRRQLSAWRERECCERRLQLSVRWKPTARPVRRAYPQALDDGGIVGRGLTSGA